MGDTPTSLEDPKMHFLLSPSKDPIENLKELHKLKPNDLKSQLHMADPIPKDVYRIAFIGDGGCGKSSLINLIWSTWNYGTEIVKMAPIGTKETPGTRFFDGPYELLDENPKRCVFELYDGMGYIKRDMNDPTEELVIKRELVQIALGKLKPGFRPYSSYGVFVPVEKKNFPGVDLFIIVARFDDKDEVTKAINLRATLIENLIFSQIVLTHAEENPFHPDLKEYSIPHMCVETPPANSELNEVLKKVVVDLLIKAASEIERKPEVKEDTALIRKVVDVSEQVQIKKQALEKNINPNYFMMSIIVVLIIALIIAVYKR